MQEIIREIKDYNIYHYQIDSIDLENKIIYTYYDYFNSGIFEIDISCGRFTVKPMTLQLMEEINETNFEETEDNFLKVTDYNVFGDFNKFLEAVEAEKVYELQELTKIYNEVCGEYRSPKAFAKLKLVKSCFEKKKIHLKKNEWLYLYRKLKNHINIPVIDKDVKRKKIDYLKYFNRNTKNKNKK